MVSLDGLAALARLVGLDVPTPQPDPFEIQFEERAAILEYECGLDRDAAEEQARAEIRMLDSLPQGTVKTGKSEKSQ